MAEYVSYWQNMSILLADDYASLLQTICSFKSGIMDTLRYYSDENTNNNRLIARVKIGTLFRLK